MLNIVEIIIGYLLFPKKKFGQFFVIIFKSLGFQGHGHFCRFVNV
jgi:hypothetical protein